MSRKISNDLSLYQILLTFSFLINKVMDINVYANTNFSYSYNTTLDNTVSWSVNNHVVTLDYEPIIIANIDVGYINSTIGAVVNNLPNAWNNFNVSITANNVQTQQLFANSLFEDERTLILQTVFTSNTGNVISGNNIYLRVRNFSL